MIQIMNQAVSPQPAHFVKCHEMAFVVTWHHTNKDWWWQNWCFLVPSESIFQKGNYDLHQQTESNVIRLSSLRRQPLWPSMLNEGQHSKGGLVMAFMQKESINIWSWLSGYHHAKWPKGSLLLLHVLQHKRKRYVYVHLQHCQPGQYAYSLAGWRLCLYLNSKPLRGDVPLKWIKSVSLGMVYARSLCDLSVMYKVGKE